MDSPRYTRAIERNLAELQWAILQRTTIQGIQAVKGASHLFLHCAYTALYNDYISHCIKVFELSKEAASFWYIYRTNEQRVLAFTEKHEIEALKTVSVKLKGIRNKTHFHIDSEGVLDPKAVWAKAGLQGSELAAGVDTAWEILNRLQQLLELPQVRLPEYHPDDAKNAALRVEGRVKSGQAELLW